MPIPSNVTNEFIAPMKSTIDDDLIDNDSIFDEWYYDEELEEYVHIGLFDEDCDDEHQFNTDDYC